MSSATTLAKIEAWNQAEAAAPSTRQQASSSRSIPALVRDDWEDDDDEVVGENEPPTVEKNKQIWEDANNKAHHPMPEVIIARSSTATASSAHIPPQGVFQQQPTMRILKRPTNASNSSGTQSSNANAMESLKEREARYQAARERIFGSPDTESRGSKSPSSPSPASQAQVKISREPLGPNDSAESVSGGSSGQTKGFGGRRALKPPTAGANSNS
ncbi:hypothetical protein FA15DRAFT_610108 [Coprinopsis marcescibilis]|uniref:SUZ domain-containing protein n=1 Tax=Coprinopsis marcescibilis TaxID=230819 RepID=A0A5C3LC18_COPMA|nr:hypothetical protein FA15DRAFT_610108 [Coprinopsis marcescibilis]